jgi:hypothetical protein
LRNALDEQSRNREIDSLKYNSSNRSSFGSVNAPFGPTPGQPSFDINAQLRRLLVDDEVKENMAHSSSFPANLSYNAGVPSAGFAPYRGQMVAPSTSYSSSLSAVSPQSSGFWSSSSNTPRHQLHHSATMYTSSHSSVLTPSAASYRSPASPAARQLAAELDEIRRIGGEIQQQQMNNTGSLPRSLQGMSTSNIHLPRQKHSTATNGTLSVESDDEFTRRRIPSVATSTGKFRRGRARSTLRNIFGKLTRSTSQDVRNPQSTNFRRGNGVRLVTCSLDNLQ